MSFFDILRGVTKMLGKTVDRQKDKVPKENNKKNSETFSKLKSHTQRKRRTDAEFAASSNTITKNADDYDCDTKVSLRRAKSSAPSEPGVYIIYLNGEVMKCGRAAYGQGLAWRFTQYYNLNYDNKARKGDYWSITPENRDEVCVSWQACPESKCEELEYKLFRKYGKGKWAQRAPKRSGDTWKLKI